MMYKLIMMQIRMLEFCIIFDPRMYKIKIGKEKKCKVIL